MFLQQRSKATWIKLGDDNNKYFYSIIKHMKLQQAVTQIQDKHGIMQHDPEKIAMVFVDYYQELLGRKEQGRVKAFGSFLKNDHILTVEEQVQLVRQYNKKDVKEALFRIDSTKSPGLDGYSSNFFKKAWSIVGEDVTEAVLEF
ncbi:PREDICTED: uncharacterized protein LOC109215329 [Nicotiana attenuata]|uniref:uncharacterized protein LOC109215329 n=1 Tax=Nicotiana attenuata TaxID=49451 RepID=UPI0009046AEC|nr:PREDICTED: uncharacterized protein LOC109215329 [Nicotiana attenuata]